jgi:polyisoprenoid-binding protein YceI
VIDTVIPLYPRRWALPLCAPAVRGGVATADTTTWSGTRGLILLKADALTMGQSLHDAYARRAIYATGSHPDIRFTIDSLTDVQPGDTLRAVVAGRFEFRGVTKQVRSQAKAWREAGGLRVTARFDLLAEDLTETFGVSTAALGLGVGLALWKYLHVGVDLVLKPIG